jgi:hypothetical protein
LRHALSGKLSAYATALGDVVEDLFGGGWMDEDLTLADRLVCCAPCGHFFMRPSR